MFCTVRFEVTPKKIQFVNQKTNQKLKFLFLNSFIHSKIFGNIFWNVRILHFCLSYNASYVHHSKLTKKEWSLLKQTNFSQVMYLRTWFVISFHIWEAHILSFMNLQKNKNIWFRGPKLEAKVRQIILTAQVILYEQTQHTGVFFRPSQAKLSYNPPEKCWGNLGHRPLL